MLRERKKHFIKPPWRVRSIQQALPGARIHESGIMENGHLYSVTYRLKDVDFSSGSDEDQEAFFQQFEGILNSLDGRTTTFKITLFNRTKNYLETDYVLLPTDYGDGYDDFRREYNSMRLNNRAQAMGLIQERYLTVTVERKNLELAEEFFNSFDEDFSKRMGNIGRVLQL